MGSYAPRLGQNPGIYRYLRPDALAMLTYIAAGVREIGGSKQPLLVTSTVRDQPYQRALGSSNPEATQRIAAHHGLRLDIERSYATRAQAARVPVHARPAHRLT